MRKAVVRQGLAVALLLAPALAAAQPASDTFEGGVLNPDWIVLQQQLGTVSLSSDQNRTPGGSQSLRFASVSGGQRQMLVRRHMGASVKGNVSIYFYDAAPNQETLYVNFSLVNTRARMVATLGTQDFDAFCYKAMLTFVDSNINLGPNQTCGVFPNSGTTSVPRTLGWHRFGIDARADTTVFTIDSAVVYTFPGTFSFDAIEISLSGPGFRPNTVAYFDDFTFTPSALCDVQASSRVYSEGGVVSVPQFRLANTTASGLAAEIKSWLGIPGAPVTLLNTGADGSTVLAAGQEVNFAPFTLFTVTGAIPRGGYELGCRVVDPKTGATLGQGTYPFIVQ